MQKPQLPVGSRIAHRGRLQLGQGDTSLPRHAIITDSQEAPSGVVSGRRKQLVRALTLRQTHHASLPLSTTSRFLGPRNWLRIGIAEKRSCGGAVGLPPEMHAPQILCPIETGAHAASEPTTHSAAIGPRLGARVVTIRWRCSQSIDVDWRAPRPDRGSILTR